MAECVALDVDQERPESQEAWNRSLSGSSLSLGCGEARETSCDAWL